MIVMTIQILIVLLLALIVRLIYMVYAQLELLARINENIELILRK